MATLWPNPEAAHMAVQLVRDFHPHLAEAVIAYLFTDQSPKKLGRPVLGKTKKTSPLERFLSSPDDADRGIDFIITFPFEAWAMLSQEQRLALVDHELCHCDYTEDEQTGAREWKLKTHDVEEFTDIIKRHGLWLADVEQMAAAIEQLRFPLEVPA